MLYVVFGVIVVVFAWLQAAYGKMQKYKKQARSQWIRIDGLLQTRSQYILKMIQLAHESGMKSAILGDIYELDGGYRSYEDREDSSAFAEQIAIKISEFLLETKQIESLKANEEFQELEDDLIELSEDLILQCDRYNQWIDLYNQHIQKPNLRVQISILGAPALKGIDLEKMRIVPMTSIE